ncbi:MAG: hypothetical protein JSS66_05915 [Armatimonadetes bacterium]|nr:hypothetical protein [Armatimonadota bacterium]
MPKPDPLEVGAFTLPAFDTDYNIVLLKQVWLQAGSGWLRQAVQHLKPMNGDYVATFGQQIRFVVQAAAMAMVENMAPEDKPSSFGDVYQKASDMVDKAYDMLTEDEKAQIKSVTSMLMAMNMVSQLGNLAQVVFVDPDEAGGG